MSDLNTIPLHDTRTFWNRAIVELPGLHDRRTEIARLIGALDHRMYPGFVLEKLYYCCVFPKFHPFVDELFGLAHGNIGLEYKPESVLYWLRICSEKIADLEIKNVFQLGRIAQDRKIKPEWIFYELWGFTNIPYLKDQDIAAVIQIMKYAMLTEVDPYNVFHWLRVGLEIDFQTQKDAGNTLLETLRRIRETDAPVEHLVRKQEIYFSEYSSRFQSIASAIETNHILKFLS